MNPLALQVLVLVSGVPEAAGTLFGYELSVPSETAFSPRATPRASAGRRWPNRVSGLSGVHRRDMKGLWMRALPVGSNPSAARSSGRQVVAGAPLA